MFLPLLCTLNVIFFVPLAYSVINKRIYRRISYCVYVRANRGATMETILGASIAVLSMYAAIKSTKSDKEKIKHTFRNLNYKVKDQEPKLFKTHKAEKYTLYSYHVPYGLVDDDKLNVLEKVLNKPVEVTFSKQKLHIKVHKKNLPERLKYVWKTTDGWTVPIGQSLSGMIYHDFDKIPHMTIAGMTRQGKTVLLKLIFAHLIHCHPDDVEFYIIDLKGGLEFNRYRKLKQLKNIASNVYEAKQTLANVLKQMKSDMSLFKEKGYTNVLDTPIMKRKFIIVDEGAELVPPTHLSREEKDDYRYCQHALSEIARIGGALGYRLIFATQYPTSDTLPRQIKQNADAKISFRLPTEVASRVAIDEQGAEQIKHVGRAIYRTADKYTVQVPYLSDIDIWERVSKHVVSNVKKEPKRRTDIIKFG